MKNQVFFIDHIIQLKNKDITEIEKEIDELNLIKYQLINEINNLNKG